MKFTGSTPHSCIGIHHILYNHVKQRHALTSPCWLAWCIPPVMCWVATGHVTPLSSQISVMHMDTTPCEGSATKEISYTSWRNQLKSREIKADFLEIKLGNQPNPPAPPTFTSRGNLREIRKSRTPKLLVADPSTPCHLYMPCCACISSWNLLYIYAKKFSTIMKLSHALSV